MATTDSFVASFATKYYYLFWRPVTAIRLGATDDNAKTEADTAFTPFIVTALFSQLSVKSRERQQRRFGDDAAHLWRGGTCDHAVEHNPDHRRHNIELHLAAANLRRHR